MNKELNSLSLLSGAAILLIGLIIGVVGSGGSQVQMGGLIHNIQESFDEGIAVDGTEVISGTGGVSFTSGAFSSTLDVTGETNVDNLIYGGDVTTLTPGDTTSTLTAAEFCNSAVLSLTPAKGAYTLTLPSTTTLAADCLTTVGDSKVVLFENAATAATSTTIAAGTGNELLEPSGGDVVIEQNEWAWIQITRVRAAEFAVIVTSFQVAD